MTDHIKIHAARERLARFGTSISGIPPSTHEAVRAVTMGMDSDYVSFEHATDDDVADAALLLDEARTDTLFRLAYDELVILDGLVVRGWTNQQIGEHLGYDHRTAAAQAGGRIKRLRKLLPSFERPVPHDGPGHPGDQR